MSMHEQVLQLWDEGIHSLQDVGNVVGLTRERVRQILVENGIHERYLKQKFKDEYERQIYAEAVSQVIDRYRQGEYLGNVIADVSVSEYIVNKLHPLTDDDKREHLLNRLLGRTTVGAIPDGFNTPCREWQGAYVGKYPRAAPIDGETYVVRIMFKLVHGRSGKTVKRACKNHKCIAVEHLEEI